MPEKKKAAEAPLFPILRGESIGPAGQFDGTVVIVRSVDQTKRKWTRKEISVLEDDIESYFESRPKEIEKLMKSVGAVITEFGTSVGEWAAASHTAKSICIAKVAGATHVLEDGMHLRVVASESVGEVFFID